MGEAAGMHPSQSHCSSKLGSCSSLNTAQALMPLLTSPQGCFHPLCRWLCSDTPVTLIRLLRFSLPAMLWPSVEVFCIYPRLLLRSPGLGCFFLEASDIKLPSPTSPFSQLLHTSKSKFYTHVLLWIWHNILTSLGKGLGFLAFESFWTWHNVPY